MEKQRYLQMDETMQNMLVKALHIAFRREKAAGQDSRELGDLLLRIARAPERRLFLSDREHRVLLGAVSSLRNDYLEAGRCSDYLDKGMLKLIKLKYKRCSVR